MRGDWAYNAMVVPVSITLSVEGGSFVFMFFVIYLV